MYCTVPSLVIIFVMQTISNQTITNQTVKTKYMLHTTNNLGQTLLNGSKKIAIVAALFLTVGLSNSFATPVSTNNAVSASTPARDGNDLIAASFHKDFKHAELMGIEVKKAYTKVTFKLSNMVLFAYYSGNGELLAVVRNIVSTQLPIQLLMELKETYNKYWITDLFEINSDNQTTYYVTLQNADGHVSLRSGDAATWETYRPE